jgi:hypothetical protein
MKPLRGKRPRDRVADPVSLRDDRDPLRLCHALSYSDVTPGAAAIERMGLPAF